MLSRYITDKEKIQVKCVCGQEFTTYFSKFKKGSRCKHCGVKKRSSSRRMSLDDVRNLFTENGCVLLDEQYKNADTPLAYICNCGEQSKMSYANFKKGHRCLQCVDLSGDKNPRWNHDRVQVLANARLRKSIYQILNRCYYATKNSKVSKSYEALGYKTAELKDRIENHENWAYVKDGDWHLDHIFPIKAFVDHGITDLKIINCLDNLRPCSKEENLIKQGRYCKSSFLQWLSKIVSNH